MSFYIFSEKMSLTKKKWTVLVTGIPKAIEEEKPLHWVSDYHPTWKSEPHGKNPILPKGINIVTVSFLQRWFTIFGSTLAKINDIYVLEKFFYESFLDWLNTCYVSFDEFLSWEESQVYDGYYCEHPRFSYNENYNIRTYRRLQLWVDDMARDDRKPWITLPCWIAAKHTTWEAVLLLLGPSSPILQEGFFEKIGRDSFQWTVEVDKFVSRKYKLREKF